MFNLTVSVRRRDKERKRWRERNLGKEEAADQYESGRKKTSARA